MTPAERIVATFTYRHEGEYARGFLEDAGIESVLLIDDVGGLYPSIGFTRRARLAVSAEDEEEARSVLEDAGIL